MSEETQTRRPWSRKKKMLVWLVGIIVTVIALWAGYTVIAEGNLEQPVYEVVETFDETELRRYAPFIIASTQLKQEGDSSLRSGFRILAGYIFGGNQPRESMAMTAPVLQQNEAGESLPMTAPVMQSPDDMRMAFVMPGGRSLNDLPTPDDESVTLSEVRWGLVAATRFSGWGTQAKFQEAEHLLRETLRTQNLTPRGPALYAQYNSPFAFPLLRRNEVLIPLVEDRN